MSLKYRDSTGTETPVAGLNGTSGELVPSVALQQSGVINVEVTEINVLVEKTVTLLSSMPDTNYEVIVTPPNVPNGTWGISNKTTTGFTFAFLKTAGSIGIVSFNYSVFKLMTDEVHQADAAHIAQNTANFAPAFSETTSYAVGAYVTYNNVLYCCTTAHTAGVWVAGHFTQVTVGGAKADKVSSATDGNLASLDANGNLADSGVVATNVIRRVNPSTSVDCNDLIDRFTEYRVGGDDTNRPTTDATGYILRTFRTGAGSTTYSQIAYQIGGGVNIYRRYFNGTIWSAWERFVALRELKSVVANSTDFEDFKTRIVAL